MWQSVAGFSKSGISISGLATQGPGIRPADSRHVFHTGRRDITRHLNVLIVLVSFFLAQLILRRMHFLKRVDAGIAGRIRMNLQNLEDLVNSDPQSIDRRIIIVGFGPSIFGMSQNRKGERDGQKQGGHKATLEHGRMIRGK